jgi:beta-lactamase class A
MSRSARGLVLTLLAFALVGVTTLTALLLIRPNTSLRSGTHAPTPTPTATPGDVTMPNPTYTAYAGKHPVGADFAAFYLAHAGATTLGTPIVPELIVGTSITQIFADGLLQSSLQTPTAAYPQASVMALISAHAAIALGAGDVLTYADLAPFVGANHYIAPPAAWSASGNPAQVGIFVPLATSAGTTVGHYIPPQLAAYLVSQPNWQAIWGAPLTEAQSVAQQDASQPLLVQAFANAVLVGQLSAPQTYTVSQQPVGSDWLSIFGPPTIAIGTALPVTISAAGLVQQAGGSTTVATFTTPFAATLLPDATWQGNILWYHVRWHNLLQTRDGWVNADALTVHRSTSNAPEVAWLNALSPALQQYVNALGANAGMSIYLPSQHRYYNYNAGLPMETASVVKVIILMTLLSQKEAAATPLTSNEQALAAAMIEQSDNDAAQALYNEEGYNPGIQQFLASIGINDVQLTLDGFGSTYMPPQTMITILEDLRTASVLTPGDCQYVLSLMGQVESDERIGVGDTAPPGATVELKDGYGVEEDGLNVMVTVGIVTYQGQTYDVAVFTKDEEELQEGIDYVNTICQDVAQALTGQP